VDELQDRLARVGLDVLAQYGFVLAGVTHFKPTNSSIG